MCLSWWASSKPPLGTFSSQPSTSTHAIHAMVWGRRNGRNQSSTSEKVKGKMPEDASFSTFSSEAQSVSFPVPLPFIFISMMNKQALNSSITQFQRFQMKLFLKKHISFPKTLLSWGGECVRVHGFASLKRTVGRRESHRAVISEQPLYVFPFLFLPFFFGFCSLFFDPWHHHHVILKWTTKAPISLDNSPLPLVEITTPRLFFHTVSSKALDNNPNNNPS